jgi:hypothetical protein
MPWLFVRRTSVRPIDVCCLNRTQSSPPFRRKAPCIEAFARYCALLMFVGSGCFALQAQSNASSISSQPPKQSLGAIDGDIVVPNATGALGHQDAAALKEITEHLAVVGSAPWLGMQGTGQIVYGAKDPTAYSATLSILQNDRFRLDAQTNKGEMSLRIHGPVGKIQGSGGPTETIPPDTAAAGIFPFGLVRTVHFPGRDTSLIDHGLTTAGGVQLHRITVETPSIGRDPVTKSRRTIAIDLYFDPATHLLAKSASSSFIAVGHSAKFLRVVTYSDYRKVGTAMVPFRYDESMDGQQYWVLQLSDVQLNPVFDVTYFQF